MNLKDVKDLSDKLDNKQSNAILGLIDKKIDSDMDKVISSINLLRNSLETKIEGQNHKIDAQDHKMTTIERLLWGLIATLAIFVITMWFKK